VLIDKVTCGISVTALTSVWAATCGDSDA